MRTRKALDLIVISTWVGEIDKYPNLKSYLKKNDIPVIENTVQNYSILQSHQKILIISGLNFCDENSYVTKHRFDRVFPSQIFEDHLVHIKQYGPERILNEELPWDYKITVNSALIDTPFFLNDLIFSGLAKNLYKLCSLDARQYLSFNAEVNPELSFYALPFFDKFKEISSYLSTYPGLVYEKTNRIQQLREVQLRSDFYPRIFALYSYLVVNCFNVGYRRDYSISPNKINLDSVLSACTFGQSNEDIFLFPAAGHMATKNNNFFNKIFHDEYVKSEFSEKVSENLSEFKLGSWEKSLNVRSQKLDLNATLYAKNLRDNGFLNFGIPGLNFQKDDENVFQNTQFQMSFQDLNGIKRDTSKVVMGEWDKL